MVGWTNQLVDEIVIPNNLPLQPGNNVIGIGQQLPPELTAAGFTNGIIFYSSSWNPSNTTPTVKFRFISVDSAGELVIGEGIAQNPSVDQTAVVEDTIAISAISNIFTQVLLNYPSGNTALGMFQQSGSPNVSTLALYQDIAAAPPAILANSGVTATPPQLQVGLNQNQGRFVLGDTVLQNPAVSSLLIRIQDVSLSNGANFIKDTIWTNLTLLNSWVHTAGNPGQYRFMPDGTVRLKGIITKGANPANGELVSDVLPSGYPPNEARFFPVPCGSRPDTLQKVRVNTDGSINVFDPGAFNGDICFDPVTWPVLQIG